MAEHAAATNTDAIWRALADPSRRQILDLLRGGPQTTGALCAHFPLSRFGVMKHLKLLTEVGLVTVARRGRERWNHLNAVPIRQIYRRWIQPFAVDRADALLDLKDRVETPSSPTQAQGVPPVTESLGVIDLALEVRIQASRDKVWQALVQDTGKWWPASFYTGAGGRNFVIEPQLGGRMYEDWGDGQGLVWATVLGIRDQEMLLLCGDTDGSCGGPSRGFHKFELSADGDATVLKFTECAFGRTPEDSRQSLDEGWRYLMGECLKPFVEEGRQPERPATVEV